MNNGHKMKLIALYASLVLSVLACLPWPIIAYLSIFIFDAPTRGIADELGRFSFALGCLTYPWGLVVGLFHYKTQKHKAAWKARISCILLLLPYLQIGLLYGILSIFGKGGLYDKDPVLERHRISENINMEIRSDDYNARQRKIGYRIFKNDNDLTPVSFLGEMDEYETHNGFVEYMGTNNDIACFAWKKYPGVVAIMIDIRSCESWPAQLPFETPEKALSRGTAWLKSFKDQPNNEMSVENKIDTLKIKR